MNNLELYTTYMLWKDFYIPLLFLIIGGITFLIISVVVFIMENFENVKTQQKKNKRKI